MDEDKKDFNKKEEGDENLKIPEEEEVSKEKYDDTDNESDIKDKEEIQAKDIAIEDGNLEVRKEETIKSEDIKPNEEDLKDNDDINNRKNTEDENTKNNNIKNKKIGIIVGTIIGLIVIGYIIMTTTVSNYDSVVYPGISIYDQNVSGLNEDELSEKIDELKSEINQNQININAKGNDYDLQMKDLALSYNETELASEIINANKDKNIFQKFISILTKTKQDYKLDIEVKEDYLKEIAETIGKDTNQKCEEPKVIINGDKITYQDGKKGIKLDTKLLLSSIEKYVKENDIYKDNIKINGEYIDDNPKINKDDLKNVNHKISTHSTTYSPGGGRGKNVEIAAQKIDDLLLMPGDEFSYEQSAGPVTQDNGYTYAPVISNGELVQGIGGGVCQVSSTLYNTQLKAGILPTERRNHSKVVGYVPIGLDATLASGSIDYKFKNTNEYPIVINTKTGGGLLTIEFWSNKDALKGIEYKPVGYASGKTANSYLYGYDNDGKKVYEKHIDTSVYR